LFQRSFLTGFAFVLLAAQACGSDDGKKHVESTDAGMGGEAGQAPEPSAGGSSAGAPSSGAAGEAPTPAGGNGGQAPVEPTAGAGGEPPLPMVPKPELLFSVKPGASGLVNSDIRAATNPENFIYTSSTGSQDPVDGTNAVKITGESLGLAPTDQIVAFALPQAEPKNPKYLFSIADGSEGADTTRTQYEHTGSNTEEGNVYFSDGAQSFRYIGEGGDQYGYNAMLATEVSLGLAVGADSPNDDLTGLAAHDANLPITELYFTVTSAAEGATDSAVATVDATERSCTVFKSNLDGTNSVAFSCAALGLLPSAADPDQIDALAVYGGADSTKVVFSVTTSSQGAVGSAVETLRLTDNGQVGCTLFESPGDQSNAVFKAAKDLGLGEYYYMYDEIDGLAVIEAPKAQVANAGSCQLTYDPLDTVAGGELTSVSGTSHVGTNVLVVAGLASATSRMIAYNATTCAFLQQVDVPSGFEDTDTTAIVPLAGWSAAKPLEKVEYLRVTLDGISRALSRYDAAGTFVQAFPITNTEYDGVEGIVYSNADDHLYLLLNESGYRRYKVFPRPGADVTSIDTPSFYRTHPCGYYRADVAGTDAAGNLYVAQPQLPGKDFRVCAFTPRGELLPAPYAWTSNRATPTYYGGFIVPGGSHFLLSMDDSPWSIERGAYQAP
jgi:hypothetical protein